jgi:putative NIF3 family GTP cyclohydrolase 1 type 2
VRKQLNRIIEAKEMMIIQEVIDTIIAAACESIPASLLPLSNTVDKVTLGDATQPVTGIISTFMATDEVIDRAIALKANLIISHETIFYNHQDEVDWLRGDALYEAKCRKIREHNLVIWRFHDQMHRMKPDMTVLGLVNELGWEANEPFLCRIAPLTLQQLAVHVKDRLHIQNLRVVGDLDQVCQGVGIFPGFMGRERHIEALRRPEVDVVICGELHEWETSEYVRDAVHMGHHKGLVITGHAESEEPGMRLLVPWLQAVLPDVAIDFVPVGSLFHWR